MRLYSHRALDAHLHRDGKTELRFGDREEWGGESELVDAKTPVKSRDEQARILQDCATSREPPDRVGATLARYGDLQLHPPRCPHRGDASQHRYNLPPAWPADICHLRSDICTGVTIPHMATRDTLPGTGRTKTHYPNSVHGSRLFHRQFLELCLLSPCSVF